jgi:hypothetical protein
MPYGIPFGSQRTAVYAKCHTIYKIEFYVDVVQEIKNAEDFITSISCGCYEVQFYSGPLLGIYSVWFVIQGVFKKRTNFCYKYLIAHFTAL